MFAFTPSPPMPSLIIGRHADTDDNNTNSTIKTMIVEEKHIQPQQDQQPVEVVTPLSQKEAAVVIEEEDDEKKEEEDDTTTTTPHIVKTTTAVINGDNDMPRVALMFLTRGPLPLEPIWKMWFETAAMMEATDLPSSPPQPLPRFLRQDADKKKKSDDDEQQQDGDDGASSSTHSDNIKRSLLSSKTLLNTTTTTAFDAEAALNSIVNTTSALSIPSPLLTNIIAQQTLFTVYVHTASNYSFPQDSIFAGQQIKDRVNVTWGQWSVAEAEKRLYTAALKDGRNQRFILLSESCMPLYPPHILWAQVMSEQRSRVRACSYKQEPLPWYVPNAFPTAFNTLWRKSSQWKMLLRQHAELVAADEMIWKIFIRACYTYLPGLHDPPPYLQPFMKGKSTTRNCISDEHYVSTLLNYHGVSEEGTTCVDSMMYTAWTPGIWSPKVYNSSHINGDLLRGMRKVHDMEEECDVEGAVASANALFKFKGRDVLLNGEKKKERNGKGGEGGKDDGVERWTYEKPLDQDCHLFGRKFAPSAAERLVEDWAKECSISKGLAIAPRCYSIV